MSPTGLVSAEYLGSDYSVVNVLWGGGPFKDGPGNRSIDMEKTGEDGLIQSSGEEGNLFRALVLSYPNQGKESRHCTDPFSETEPS